jgi:calcineurin-like phosphoesterase
LPKGTAYLSDVGMTGPHDGVLGREKEPVIAKFLDGMPRRFEVSNGDVRLSGALLELDPARGLAEKIELLTRKP